MDQKPTVSIGIPAFNEEANIKYLLDALLSQKQDNFILKEIIVVSDGSTDGTVQTARLTHNDKILVLDNRERVGQALVQNQILQMFKGEILVLLNADILLKNELFLKNMVDPLLNNSKIGIVSTVGVPLPAVTFFEKIINFSVLMKENMFGRYNDGDNIYICHGRSRAFSRAFTNKLKWPPILGEDAYSYILCKEKGFAFYHASDAEIVYRSPQNIQDHLKQSVRFIHSRQELFKYFPKDAVAEYYHIPWSLLALVCIKFFPHNPILFVCYIFVYFTTAAGSFFRSYTNVKWDPSTSSKILVGSNTLSSD